MTNKCSEINKDENGENQSNNESPSLDESSARTAKTADLTDDENSLDDLHVNDLIRDDLQEEKVEHPEDEDNDETDSINAPLETTQTVTDDVDLEDFQLKRIIN